MIYFIWVILYDKVPVKRYLITVLQKLLTSKVHWAILFQRCLVLDIFGKSTMLQRILLWIRAPRTIQRLGRVGSMFDVQTWNVDHTRLNSMPKDYIFSMNKRFDFSIFCHSNTSWKSSTETKTESAKNSPAWVHIEFIQLRCTEKWVLQAADCNILLPNEHEKYSKNG